MRSLVTVAGVAALLLSPLPAKARSEAITFPRAGEVCDQVGQVCYDSSGPSIGITKIYFGQFAADRLTANLRGSNSRDFRLIRVRPAMCRNGPVGRMVGTRSTKPSG